MSSRLLDDESKRFQAEVDALVREWAGTDEQEYWRRWKQLGSWSINKTQGDVVKKAALKQRLMTAMGGRCQDCGREFEVPALHMHRLEQAYAHDRSKNFGYFDGNVAFICSGCHERREAARR